MRAARPGTKMMKEIVLALFAGTVDKEQLGMMQRHGTEERRNEMEEMKLRNYHIQEDIECCYNCAQKDTAVDINATEYPLCTIFGDPVNDVGICDDFEF